MFEMEQVLEDPHYLYLKTSLEKVCFSKGIETTNLFRDGKGAFVCQDSNTLDGIFAAGSFTRQEILSFEKYTYHPVFVDSSPDDEKYFSTVPSFQLDLRQALNRFIEAGHRKMGFVGSHYTLQEAHDLKLDSRLYYFRNILQERGIYEEQYELDWGMDSARGYQVLCDAPARWEPLPTALFIASDAIVRFVL